MISHWRWTPPNVEFADEVTLTLEVTFPDNYSVVVHKLPERWGPAFEVRDQSQAHTLSNDDGTKTTSQTIRAVVFGRGTVQTPDLPISIRSPDGTVEQASPLPKELIVGSVLPGPDAEPKDIRRQADIATQIWEQPVARAGAALVAVLALCALGYLLYRRFYGQGGPPLPVLDPRTPWEIAIDELDRIERLDLPEDGRFKEHYTLVAATMRVYVQAMYLRDVSPVDAIDMTTDEIWDGLRRSSLDYDDAKLVLDLLREADFVEVRQVPPSPVPGLRGLRSGAVYRGGDAARLPAGRGVAKRYLHSAGGAGVNDLSFGSPWLLLLLPGVVLLATLPYVWKRQMAPVGMRYADTGLVSGIGSSLRLRVMPFVSGLRFVALALVIIAVARPQSADAREVIRGEGVDIAIALDISGSMGAEDFDPHRLEAAKQIIADFIEERKYDRIGLVVFSRDAFVQSPPTLDHSVLLRLLSEVDLADRLRIQDGTAIGSGMATAANMLKDSTAENKLVTLLTDGVNNAGDLDPLTVATAAEALEIKVYTIGVGRRPRSADPQLGPFGGSVVMQQNSLDEETLQQIAAITNAKYYRATDTDALRGIYEEINALEKSEIEILHFTTYRELAAWFLVPALLLLLLELVLSQTVFRKIP